MDESTIDRLREIREELYQEHRMEEARSRQFYRYYSGDPNLDADRYDADMELLGRTCDRCGREIYRHRCSDSFPFLCLECVMDMGWDDSEAR